MINLNPAILVYAVSVNGLTSLGKGKDCQTAKKEKGKKPKINSVLFAQNILYNPQVKQKKNRKRHTIKMHKGCIFCDSLTRNVQKR